AAKDGPVIALEEHTKAARLPHLSLPTEAVDGFSGTAPIAVALDEASVIGGEPLVLTNGGTMLAGGISYNPHFAHNQVRLLNDGWFVCGSSRYILSASATEFRSGTHLYVGAYGNFGHWLNVRVGTHYTNNFNGEQRLELRANVQHNTGDFTLRAFRDGAERRFTYGENKNPSFTQSGQYSRLIADSHTITAGWNFEWRDFVSRASTKELGVSLLPIFDGQDVEARVARYALFLQDEWEVNKRTREKTRETLHLTQIAMDAERALFIFPAGRLARLRAGVLSEQEWMSSAIAIARKNKAPLVPIHLTGPRSFWFHFLGRFSSELRDITLFKELLNKKGESFNFSIGGTHCPLIVWLAMLFVSRPIYSTLSPQTSRATAMPALPAQSAMLVLSCQRHDC
ncbi:MAG: hypothetical protein HC777_01605, partial [Hyphomonadaceae bacterium]|nr:hypothetical protein [Hyphomonadaceae bacterium]